MLFLMLLIPLALLSAFLAWRCWQVAHPKVALAMVAACLACTVMSALLIYGMHYLYEALRLPVAG